MKRISLYIIFLFIISPLFSQNYIITKNSVAERSQLAKKQLPNKEKAYAEEFARLHGIPIRYEYKNGSIIEIMKISSNGLPLYYKTQNFDAANTISTDKLWKGGVLGLDLDGDSIVVGVWDGGAIRKTHVEFEDRVRLIEGGSTPVFHATHVAGTIGAAGIRNDAHGMANKSTIDGYDWTDDNEEMFTAAQQGLLISNHSYGYVQGWEYNDDEERWEWYGDESISKTEDFNFGFYGDDAKVWDDIAFNNPKYLIVKSAGNDRGQGPSPGTKHYVWSGLRWKESFEIRDLDGEGNYDCIGSQGTSKNILSVGAAYDIHGGYNNPEDIKLAAFSVFGPTDDGRIKPDILGNGIALISTNSTGDNSYTSSSGTSMSCPNVAGSLALLQQHYENIHATYMYASMLKALVLHTADDAENPGPDYKSGWGLMNTAAAASIISQNIDENLIYDTLLNLQSNEYRFYSTGQQDIKVTIVWTDPSGKVPDYQLDPRNRILVNDLDIRLNRSIDSMVFEPFRLDPDNPTQNAVPGDNYLDNIEQIVVHTPLPGYYRLIVSHKSSLKNNEQTYSIVISGMTKEYVASGLINLNDNNGEVILTSGNQYKNSMDVKWLIEPENKMPVQFYFDYFRTEINEDIIRIYDGDEETAPLIAEFSGQLSNSDTIIKSSAGKLLVVFESNESVVDTGFYARYCTVAPKDTVLLLGNLFPCENSISSYIALGGKGIEFLWESQNDNVIIQTSKFGIDLEIKEVNDLLKVIPYNRCGSGLMVERIISPLHNPPELDMLTGDTIPCAGVETEYSTSAIEGATYLWRIPKSWIGDSDSSSIIVLPKNSSGKLIVTAQNACGAGTELLMNLSGMDIPDEDSIFTEKEPPCAGTVQRFFVKALPGYSYHWSVNFNWELISGEETDTAQIGVGITPTFVNILTSNKCGSRESGRLFKIAPLPSIPIIDMEENDFGYPQLSVTSKDTFKTLQWYFNGEKVQGNAGTKSPFIAMRNGLYTVALVNDDKCVRLLEDEKGIQINQDKFTFVAYRINEGTVIIENSLKTEVNVEFISIKGSIEYFATLQPGNNTIDFINNGVFLLYFYGYGDQSVLKVKF